jgi:photosystem II stability/assembly factor-like uncharacterized protein
MKWRWFVNVSTLVISMAALFVLLGVIGSTALAVANPAPAVPAEIITPTVAGVEPQFAFNDLDASIVITGTDFTAGLSDTLVLTPPTASLGSTPLKHVTWVDSTTLTATVPWGMDPGIYPLTVVNPDGGAGSLTNTFTVTKGIGQWNSGDLFGGEVRQILLKPGDPNTVYALAIAVGLFRSRDAGEHWRYTNGKITGNGNSNFVIDPLHPSWLYSYAYDGLYRSEDEGDTWMKVIDTWPDGRSVDKGQVYVSPHNAQVLFVSSSAQPGYPPNGVMGLIKSTNGGVSWNIVTDMESIPVQSVDFHPTDPLKMVLATQAGQVYQSTDGGNHWSQVLKPPVSNLGSITYNPYKPSEVWITFSGDTGIYKSTDAAFTSWQNVTPADNPVNNQSIIKFTSADSIYINRHHSEDGGLTWYLFGPFTSYGVMLFDPNNSQIGYIGDDIYGVQKTFDGGQTWEIKSQGLSGMSAYEIEASRADPLRVYATFGGWPGIYRSDDGANNWTFIPIDGSYNARVVHEDPFDPQRIYVAADPGFYVSTNGGVSWSDLGWPTFQPGQGGMPYAMEPDPYQPGHLLVGFRVGSNFHTADTGQLYSSSNYGVTWQPITVTQDLAWIVDIAFHPEAPGLVYLSTDGTGLYRSTNSGNAWDRIDDLQQPDMQKSTHITIATHPQHVLFVGTDRQCPYRSMDGGATWNIAHCPDNLSATVYMFLDRDSTRLYAATGLGLFFSSSAGNSWERAAGKVSELNISALDYTAGNNYMILYAATSGGDPELNNSSIFHAIQPSDGLQENLSYTRDGFNWSIFLPLVRRDRLPDVPNNLVKAGVYRFVQR